MAGSSLLVLLDDLNTPTALYPFDLQAGYAYNRCCVGHRYSPLN